MSTQRGMTRSGAGRRVAAAAERAPVPEHTRSLSVVLIGDAEEAQAVAHVGSWEWDVATDTVLWSGELYKIYGLDPPTFRPSYAAFLDRVHPDDRALVEGSIGGAFTSGTVFEFDHRIRRPDGAIRRLYCRGEVERDEAGHPVRMTGIGQDVTEARAREEALAVALRRLGEARALAGIGNWELDLATRQVEWSDELYDLYGLDRETFIPSFDAFFDMLDLRTPPRCAGSSPGPSRAARRGRTTSASRWPAARYGSSTAGPRSTGT